ncbi:TPA: hemagglutinin repeat-containing protein, partial [Neisseria weaveri]
TFESAENTDKRSSHLGSNVGSGGDILLKAGEVYNQRGSHIRADGNTHILAKNVNVEAAEAAYLVSDKESYTRKGINVGVGSPAVNAINNAKQSIQSTAKQTENIGESKNSRTNAMAAVNAGIGAYRAVKDVQTAYQSVRNGKGFKPTINITYGEQRNTAEQSQQGHTVSPSGIQAGGKVMIEAAGAGEASTITVSGSDVAGQQGTALLADGDVRLHSA